MEGRHKDAGYITLGIGSHRDQFECTQHQYADVFQGLENYQASTTWRLTEALTYCTHPRRIPVALKDKLKHELREMVNDDIATTVHLQSAWIHGI